jgi:hypothetical protein
MRILFGRHLSGRSSLTLTARRHPVPLCGIKFHLPATLPHGISNDNTIMRATPYALGAYRRSICTPLASIDAAGAAGATTTTNLRVVSLRENERSNHVVIAKPR